MARHLGLLILCHAILVDESNSVAILILEHCTSTSGMPIWFDRDTITLLEIGGEHILNLLNHDDLVDVFQEIQGQIIDGRERRSGLQRRTFYQRVATEMNGWVWRLLSFLHLLSPSGLRAFFFLSGMRV